MAPRKPKKQQVKKLQQRPKILFLMWLVFVLDHKIFPGLKWSNRKEGRFRISCTHQRSKNWRRDRAAHCKGWSMIKKHWYGKEDRTHKACFRTTLNSKGKKGNEQLKTNKMKIKGVDGDWMEYCFINKSFLFNEPDPFLQSYYLEGRSSSTNFLPPFDREFKNDQRNEPERQNIDTQDPTTMQKEVLSSVSKSTKPVGKQKIRVKRLNTKVQRPRSRKNDTSTTTQNSSGNAQLTQNNFLTRDETVLSPLQYWNQGTPEPQTTDVVFKENGNAQLTQNNFLARDETVMSPLQYWNQRTPEPQTTDVVFKENGYQNVPTFKNQENCTFNSGYQPCTPISSFGDIQEAFSPNSLHHDPPNYHNNLNCIYNPNENSFYPSTTYTSNQNEYVKVPVKHEFPQPFDPEDLFQESQSIRDTDTISRITEFNFEHLPDSQQNEEALFNRVYSLLEKQGILAYLEFDNTY